MDGALDVGRRCAVRPGCSRCGRFLAVSVLLCCLLVVQAWPVAASGEGSGTYPARDEGEIALGIGGVGGVYFLATPGTLIVDVEKRDLNRRRRCADMRLIFVGPDRRVLQEVAIPDDGRPLRTGTGPAKRVRLIAHVARRGVYGLNVTVAGDRYGTEIVWGFRTNCPHYLIETSRGHRDARHTEPIVVRRPHRQGDVCFLPRPDAFAVEVEGLPVSVKAVSMHDATGRLVRTLKVARGKASHTFPADPNRGEAPWRLHLPAYSAVVHIDGVTRWERDEVWNALSLWSPDIRSCFPLHAYRWLLTPYSRLVYGQAGEKKEIAFRVHNNTLRDTTVDLSLERAADATWPVLPSQARVAVAARKSVGVVLAFTVPREGDTHVFHLRATPASAPEFSTYSTVEVKLGVAPAAAPLDMPIVLKPYRHENEQFGYLPDYPVDSQVYFDMRNRPCVRTDRGVATKHGKRWHRADFATATRGYKDAEFRRPSTKIAFDRDNGLYALATVDKQPALVHSTDGGKTFSVSVLDPRTGRGGTLEIEQFSGHNIPDGPPPVLRYRRTASDPKLKWRSMNDLELFLPRKVGGTLEWGKPILISRKCIGLSAHSGIPSSVVSRGSRVHVTWGEATDPKTKVLGVPTYVATFDRDTGKLGKPVLVGHGPPANDVHNSPCITMDSKGYLHVLVGTHGRTFKYARSMRPNDSQGGWTPTEDVGKGLSQTYVGLVCDRDDALHLVFRLWRRDPRYFPNGSCAALSHMNRRPGKPWSQPRDLLVAAFCGYSIYYHRLTIDRRGRLFLSYDYWSTYWFYRTDHAGRRRALLVSGDGGDTWRMVGKGDFR